MSSANGLPDTDDPEVTLGIRLFMARRRKNFSQGDIAALTGYSRNTVSSYEADLSKPPLTPHELHDAANGRRYLEPG